jgi:hypothetical protein
MAASLLLPLVVCAALCAAEPTMRVCRVSDQRVLVYDPRLELGIGMHGMPDEQIALVKALGIRLVRHTLYWNQVENTEQPGVYDPQALAEWDDLVRRCDAQGIVLEVVVHANAPGVSYADREAGYRRFARFMGDMARRYPSIRYWELWNEMDAGFTDLFGAQAGIPLIERGKLYAQMLKIVSPVVREANPQAVILVGGMSDTSDFPTGIYEGGGREFFDVMNVHTYGVPVWWSFVARGLHVRSIMDAHGDADKPLWNTEFGIDAGNLIGAWGYPHDRGEKDAEALDQMQLDQWRKCIELARETGLYTKIIPYQFAAGNERNGDGQIATKTQLPAGLTIDDFGFGIVRADGRTPRPTYDWLKQQQINSGLGADEPRAVEAWIANADGLRPEGYEYERRDAALVAKGVPLSAAYATVVRLVPE